MRLARSLAGLAVVVVSAAGCAPDSPTVTAAPTVNATPTATASSSSPSSAASSAVPSPSVSSVTPKPMPTPSGTASVGARACLDGYDVCLPQPPDLTRVDAPAPDATAVQLSLAGPDGVRVVELVGFEGGPDARVCRPTDLVVTRAEPTALTGLAGQGLDTAWAVQGLYRAGSTEQWFPVTFLTSSVGVTGEKTTSSCAVEQQVDLGNGRLLRAKAVPNDPSVSYPRAEAEALLQQPAQARAYEILKGIARA